MSADVARHHLEKMVQMECRGWGDQAPALERIAERYHIPAGTLVNIRTGRAKRIFSDIRDAIRIAYLDMCAAEVRKWQHELVVERARGNLDDDLEDMEREAEDLAARIQARLEKFGRPR